MTTLSLQEYRKLAKKPKRSKYGAIKTKVDGVLFASKREAARYSLLKLREKAGEISGLRTQPTYDITLNGIFICKVKLDFWYFDKTIRQQVIEDSKGMDNPMSRLKRKLVQAKTGIKVELV